MKKIKRKIEKVVSFLVSTLITAVYATSCIVFAESEITNETEEFKFNGDMNFDVVFVADASGSMKYADPKMISSQAMSLFMDMCDKNNCRAGYVVYSHELVDSHDLIELNNLASVEEIRNGIMNVEYLPDADTDIALGLTEAMRIQEKSSSGEERNPMIVLLSDGRTDLPKGPRTVEESDAELQQTIEQLTDESIPVYTIGLNYDGSVDSEQMKNIADSTGGKYSEAKDASELYNIIIDIFADYNNIEDEEITPTYEGHL